MTKYYRVRTQEQWDWLMQWFEEQDNKATWSLAKYRPTQFDCPKEINEPIVRRNEDKSFDVFDLNSVTMPDTIEVSDLMEESKMEDYVTIKGKDLKNIEMFRGDESKGNLEELWDVNKVNIPKSLFYPKVPMAEAEKKEFDKLKDEMSLDRHDLDDLLTRIRASDYPHLYHRLYVADGDGVKSQLEFACAWADPSLIEVIPEDKYWVKCYPTDDCYFYKYEGKILAGVPRVHLERFQFRS